MAWRAGSVSDRRTCSEPVLRSLTLPARHEWRFRLAKAKSAEDAVALMLLIFLTVSLGIAAGYQMLWEWFHPDARRVRQRMAEEFGKELGPVSSRGCSRTWISWCLIRERRAPPQKRCCLYRRRAACAPA